MLLIVYAADLCCIQADHLCEKSENVKI